MLKMEINTSSSTSSPAFCSNSTRTVNTGNVSNAEYNSTPEEVHQSPTFKNDIHNNNGKVEILQVKSEGSAKRAKEFHKYKCNVCNKYFSSKANLKQHSWLHSDKKRYKCVTCSESFSHIASLKIHQYKHKEEIFKCYICGRILANPLSLKTHIKGVHGIEQPKAKAKVKPAKPVNKCHVCDKHFSSRTSLTVHNRKHTGEKRFKCGTCSEAFSYAGGLKIHEYKHKNEIFKCEICDRVLSNPVILKYHLENVHGLNSHHKIKNNKPQDRECAKVIQCKECLKCFSNAINLKHHMRQHSREKPLENVHGRNSAHKQKKCKLQGRRSPKAYQCKDCLKCCSNTYNLKYHMRQHSREKPTEDIHGLNSAHKQKNYKPPNRKSSKIHQCKECQKCFSNASNLKHHSRLHSGEKPYECKDCGQRFTFLSTLKSHQLSKHENMIYVCEICDKILYKLQSLEIHMSKEHNMTYKIINGELHKIMKIDRSNPPKCTDCNQELYYVITLEKYRSKTCKTLYKCERCEDKSYTFFEPFVSKYDHASESWSKKMEYFTENSACGNDIDNESTNFDENTIEEMPEKVRKEMDNDVGPLSNNDNHNQIASFIASSPKGNHTSQDESSILEPHRHNIISSSEKNNIDNCSNITHSFLPIEQASNIEMVQPLSDDTVTNRCRVCEKDFASATTLKNHMRIHTGEKPYACEQCSQKFTFISSLYKHVFLVHGKKLLRKKRQKILKDYSCQVCKKVFANGDILKHHMRLHTGEKLFHCEICSESFTFKASLTAHNSSKHNSKYRCEFCDTILYSKESLQNHMHTKHDVSFESEKDAEEICDGSKSSHCTGCVKALVFVTTLRHNNRNYTRKNLYKCEVCNKSFTFFEKIDTSTYNLRNSNASCEKTMMERTPMSPVNTNDTACNFDVFPEGNSTDPQSNTGSNFGVVVIEPLDTSFNEVENLSRCCTNERNSNSVLPLSKELPQMYDCFKCAMCFSTSAGLFYHIRTHQDDTEFDCVMCKEVFKTNEILKNHVQTVHTKSNKCMGEKDMELVKTPATELLEVYDVKHDHEDTVVNVRQCSVVVNRVDALERWIESATDKRLVSTPRKQNVDVLEYIDDVNFKKSAVNQMIGHKDETEKERRLIKTSPKKYVDVLDVKLDEDNIVNFRQCSVDKLDIRNAVQIIPDLHLHEVVDVKQDHEIGLVNVKQCSVVVNKVNVGEAVEIRTNFHHNDSLRIIESNNPQPYDKVGDHDNIDDNYADHSNNSDHHLMHNKLSVGDVVEIGKNVHEDDNNMVCDDNESNNLQTFDVDNANDHYSDESHRSDSNLKINVGVPVELRKNVQEKNCISESKGKTPHTCDNLDDINENYSDHCKENSYDCEGDDDNMDGNYSDHSDSDLMQEHSLKFDASQNSNSKNEIGLTKNSSQKQNIHVSNLNLDDSNDLVTSHDECNVQKKIETTSGLSVVENVNTETLLKVNMSLYTQVNIINDKVTKNHFTSMLTNVDGKNKQDVDIKEGKSFDAQDDDVATYTFQCELCSKSFPKEFSLKVHMRMHRRSNKYKKSFKTAYECDICKNKFRALDKFKTHQRYHTGERPYKCFYCEQRFIDYPGIGKHISSMHTNIDYRCEICEINIDGLNNFKMHLKHHHNWSTRKMLKFVRKGNTVLKSMNCQISDELEVEDIFPECISPMVPVTPSENDNNLGINRCEVCSSEFNSRTGLRIHLNTKHKYGAENICLKCGKLFENESKLSLHTKEKHSQSNAISNILDDETYNKKNTKCEEDFNDLVKECVKLMNTDKTVYHCPRCGFKSFTPPSLMKHIQLHKDKDYNCVICEENFVSSTNLKSHVIKHKLVQDSNSKMTYAACTICGRGFSHRLSKKVYADIRLKFKMHMRTHKPVKLLKCNLCDKRFKFRPSLHYHILGYHSDIEFNCPLCTVKYKSPISLRSHMTKMHHVKCRITNTGVVEVKEKDPKQSTSISGNHSDQSTDTVTSDAVNLAVNGLSVTNARNIESDAMRVDVRHLDKPDDIQKHPNKCTSVTGNDLIVDCVNGSNQSIDVRDRLSTVSPNITEEVIDRSMQVDAHVPKESLGASETISNESVADNSDQPEGYFCQKHTVGNKIVGNISESESNNMKEVRDNLVLPAKLAIQSPTVGSDNDMKGQQSIQNDKNVGTVCDENTTVSTSDEQVQSHYISTLQQDKLKKIALENVKYNRLKINLVDIRSTSVNPLLHCNVLDNSINLKSNENSTVRMFSGSILQLNNENGVADNNVQAAISDTVRESLIGVNSLLEKENISKNHSGNNSKKCEICTEIVEDLDTHLKSHIRIRGKNDDYRCKICHLVFERSLSLEIHSNLHKEISDNFNCVVCRKKLKSRLGVSKHMRSHTMEDTYKCVVCSKLFRDSNQLNLHVFTHINYTTFKCEDCDKVFQNYQQLQNHLRFKILKSNRCAVCRREFMTKDLLKRHDCAGTFKQTLHECNICGKKLASPSKLKQHINVKHLKLEPYKCSICDQKFAYKQALNRHMDRHLHPESLKCEICQRTFAHKTSLANHVKTVHNGTKTRKKGKPKPEDYIYKCAYENCNKAYTDQKCLLIHKRLHTGEKPYECKQCGEKFLYYPTYTNHVNSHLGVKYQCPDCGKTFTSKFGFNTHLNMHKGIKPTKKTEKVKCTVCDRLLRKSSYKNHMRIHEGILHFTCEECGKSFSSNAILTCHKLYHLPDDKRPFQCTVCSRGFISRYRLDEHRRIHTGEKHIKCNICNRAFARTRTLRIHMNSHTDEKPYKCKVCAKGFSTNGALYTHRIIHTGKRPYSCTFCDKTFKDRSARRMHIKSHNKNK